MTVTQTAFRAALLDPSAPVPEGLSDPEGRPASKRFDVYRNNVAASLSNALETAFPVLRKLVGEANFKVLAGAFLRAHPPVSPLLMFYGDEMPGFLATFGPTSAIGYLPDIARIELALREAYHASDSVPADSQALGALSPDDLMRSGLQFAPAMRIVASPWPVHSVWRFTTEAGAPKPEQRAETVLITRPGFDPEISALPPGGAPFIRALADGANLGSALVSEGVPEDFDLAAVLGPLIAGQAITKVRIVP